MLNTESDGVWRPGDAMSREDTTRGDASRDDVRRDDGRPICRGVETSRASAGCLQRETFRLVLRGVDLARSVVMRDCAVESDLF